MELKFNLNFNINKKEVEEQMKRVLFEAMLKMQELAIMKCPVDTGRLRSSIKLFPMTPGATSYLLADGVDYGINVEYGTSPHYVGVKNLEGWAQRVLGDKGLAYPVAKKIALHGVDASPFFRPSLKQVKDIHLKHIMAKYF